MNNEICECGHPEGEHEELLRRFGRPILNRECRSGIATEGACPCKEYQPAVERGCGAAMQERLDNLGTALGRMLAEDIAEIERG
tara:strand:+ start:53 stop:304 length:252 start_codon:yes stop_codon:yes gene_type:complete